MYKIFNGVYITDNLKYLCTYIKRVNDVELDLDFNIVYHRNKQNDVSG